MTRAVRSYELGHRALMGREEDYCRFRAENLSQTQAWKQAGFPVSVDARGAEVHNASRMERRRDVQARIRFLRHEATEFAGVRRIHVINRLDRLGRANMQDFFEPLLDGNGDRVLDRRGRPVFVLKDITALPRELTAALSGIEWDGDGQPKIKLHDATQANKLLLQYFGDIPDDDDRPHRGMNLLDALSIDDQLTLAAVLEALATGAKVIGGETAGEREPSPGQP